MVARTLGVIVFFWDSGSLKEEHSFNFMEVAMTNKSTPDPNESEKKLAPYEQLSRAMQEHWLERLFNLFKLKNTLLIGDAWLTFAFCIWGGFTAVMLLLFAFDPLRFPMHASYFFSLGTFLVYYAVIGFIRRQADRNYSVLCAEYPAGDARSITMFKDKKPYDEKNDPPIVRFAFRLRRWFLIPRRGAAQTFIVVWQFLVGLAYVLNYCLYVLYRGDTSLAVYPEAIWYAQVTMTGGGLLILLKNAGFLFDTSKLLKTLQGLIGSALGHTHTEVTVTSTTETGSPLPKKEDRKE